MACVKTRRMHSRAKHSSKFSNKIHLKQTTILPQHEAFLTIQIRTSDGEKQHVS